MHIMNALTKDQNIVVSYVQDLIMSILMKQSSNFHYLNYVVTNDVHMFLVRLKYDNILYYYVSFLFWDDNLFIYAIHILRDRFPMFLVSMRSLIQKRMPHLYMYTVLESNLLLIYI